MKPQNTKDAGKAVSSRKSASNEALEDAILSIQKSYGEGSIMRMGDSTPPPIDGISTGSLGLDLAIGGKGLPRGRVIEVFGPESSGKTTLTLHAIHSMPAASASTSMRY